VEFEKILKELVLLLIKRYLKGRLFTVKTLQPPKNRENFTVKIRECPPLQESLDH
jgi:hypothetical protein